MGGFFQEGPQLTNPFAGRALYKDFLQNTAPDTFPKIEAELIEFGDRIVSKYHPLSVLAETNHPKQIRYEAWGKRIDHIEMHPAWDQMQSMVAEDGIVACAYEREFAEYSRVYQMIRIAALHPSSAFVICPLSMTDGAARVLELFKPGAFAEDYFKKLISRDPKRMWTAGQWMTERSGGSDVSGTETLAEKDGEFYKLYGTKWFTSAITAQLAMALGRLRDGDKDLGLSLFCLEIRDAENRLNHIQMNRLKDKLGTKAMPTAELELQGSQARLIGEVGKGVKNISSILNITRIYNSACAVGTLNRGLMLARDYGHKRKAFGRYLKDHPLHVRTLYNIELRHEAQFHLLMRVAHLMGKTEVNTSSAEENYLLRLLTPVLKLWTAKESVMGISELVESFGGAGYIEDTEIPRLYRDVQVFSIWEGTTNILSLDVLRVLHKEGSLDPFWSWYNESVNKLTGAPQLKGDLLSQGEQLMNFLNTAMGQGQEALTASARSLAMGLGQLASLASWIDYAHTSKSMDDVFYRKLSDILAYFARNLDLKVLGDDEIRHQRALLFDTP